MNKQDIKLLVILVVVISLLFSILFLFFDKETKNAYVYYEDKLVLTIDLQEKETKTYEVDGALGKVVFETENQKIRVIEENSPNHICSKQGYISKSYEVLVCLPNKIVVKLENDQEIDAIVK